MCTHDHKKNYTRRDFLTKTSLGLGALTMGSMLDPMGLFGNDKSPSGVPNLNGGGVLGQVHFPPKVKRVIYLFQSGAPSQIDLFDHKPTK